MEDIYLRQMGAKSCDACLLHKGELYVLHCITLLQACVEQCRQGGDDLWLFV
jgi:hypothetical protein